MKRTLKLRVMSSLLAAGLTAAGCSSGGSSLSNSSTTTAADPLSVLLARVDSSVAMYVERSVLQRPQLLNYTSKADLTACTTAISREIARSVYLNRSSQTPTSSPEMSPEIIKEMNFGEALAAAQSQIEPALSQCAKG